MHIPVLLDEVIAAAKGICRIATCSAADPIKLFDGTFGRGGHSKALMDELSGLRIMAIDRDLAAIEAGKNDWKAQIEAGCLDLRHSDLGSLHRLDEGFPPGTLEASDASLFDLIILDLGVSSPQLDESDRGFSFYSDGPLDMRMNQSCGKTAQDVINRYSAQDLSDLFYQLGEIYYPNRVVTAIIERRKENLFSATKDLADLIERVDGWQKKGMHPATKYFMALRLHVNQELEQLALCLPQLTNRLRMGGRFMVIAFHSLEDRIVKQYFKKCRGEGIGMPIYKKPLQATDEEVKLNPRSRSAKLRIFEKGKKRERKKYQ